MRRTALRILKQLRKQPATITELADALDKNQGWISELVTGLEDQNLVTKNNNVKLADNYEAQQLEQLAADYDIEELLTGKREDILKTLLKHPGTASDLEKQGFAQSTIYQTLKKLRATGVLEETTDGYRIRDETVRSFLKTRVSRQEKYTASGETIQKNPSESKDSQLTAFSAFARYGIEYYPSETYLYRNGPEIELEDVLMHAVRFAESKKQTAMCAVFYLTHSATLDNQQLWQLARKWNCVEKWADLLAFLDQREIHQEELFLPWNEFTEFARDYNVYPRGKHPGESLVTGLEELGDTLETEMDAYLLGGGNLILRGLKDSTKDLDVVVESWQELKQLVEALQRLGYEERRDLEEVYEQFDPGIVMEKQGFPRWDIFVNVVANQLELTGEMKNRVDETREHGRLKLHLLSLTDIFLFKAVTEREGDLEDNALITRQGAVNWQQVLEEIQVQEELTERYISFSVLDTLDLLEDRYGIKTPIHQRLVSHCLENALLVALNQPKTIKDLRKELDFPDHQIYNKLRKLEEENRVQVDRTGKLNTYSRNS